MLPQSQDLNAQRWLNFHPGGSRHERVPFFVALMLAVGAHKIIGSMADVPKDLLEQIKELERLFIVDQPKLKEVTDHFVTELEKGKSNS